MNYLCLDYGRRHLGLALAATTLAEPFQTIPTSQAFSMLPSLIKTHNIDQIIIGLSEGQMASETQAFAQQLSQHVSVPIHFHDETLTSQDAKLHLHHAKKKTRSGPDHHFAAALILQDFLDTQSS